MFFNPSDVRQKVYTTQIFLMLKIFLSKVEVWVALSLSVGVLVNHWP